MGAFLILLLAVPTAAGVVGPETLLSPHPGAQWQPHVAARGNDLVVVWNGATENTAVLAGTATSRDGGATWTQAGPLPIGNGARGIWGQTAVTALDGTFHALSKGAGSGGRTIVAHLGRFDADGFSWSLPFVFFPPHSDDFDHPWLAGDPDRGFLYGAYARFPFNPPVRIEFVRSLDGGLTWSPIQVLAEANTPIGPKPVVGPDGELYVFWVERESGRILCRKSVDFGSTFGPEREVATIHQNLASGPPGYRHYGGREPGTQFPAIDIDRTSGPNRGTIYLTWPERASGPASPYLSSIGESGYNDYFAGATPVAIGHDLYGTLLTSDLPPYQADIDIVRFEGLAGQTLLIDWQLWGQGSDFGYPVGMTYTVFCGDDTTSLGIVAEGRVPESSKGSAHPTAFTVPKSGRYFIQLVGSSVPYHLDWLLSLREQIVDPGSIARDHRDLVLIQSSDGGQTWSGRRRVNDDPPLFDNALPDLAVDEAGRVHVAWYDRRDDPDCTVFANVYHARSAGGDAGFAPATRVTSVGSSWQFFLSQMPSNVGGHLAVLPRQGRALVLWTDSRRQDPSDIFGAWVEDDGTSTLIGGFSGRFVDHAVELRWTIEEGAPFDGFKIHRAEGERETWEPLTDVPIPSTAQEYVWRDALARPGQSYSYRLEAIGPEGSTWEGPVRVHVPAGLTAFGWRSAGPNPFRDSIRFELAVPTGDVCTVRVHDVRGRTVLARTLEGVNGVATLAWDGQDLRGRPVSAGLYFVGVTLGSSQLALRIVKLN